MMAVQTGFSDTLEAQGSGWRNDPVNDANHKVRMIVSEPHNWSMTMDRASPQTCVSGFLSAFTVWRHKTSLAPAWGCPFADEWPNCTTPPWPCRMACMAAA